MLVHGRPQRSKLKIQQLEAEKLRIEEMMFEDWDLADYLPARTKKQQSLEEHNRM